MDKINSSFYRIIYGSHMKMKFDELKAKIEISSSENFDNSFHIIVEAYEKGEIDSYEYVLLYEALSEKITIN